MQETLKLSVGQSDGNESVVPVRWCLERSEAERIAKYCGMAWVLIAVVHEKAGEVARHLFPLDRVMDYIQFNRPGRHTLYATVVYLNSGKYVNSVENQAAARRGLLARARATQSAFAHKLFCNMGEGSPEFRPMWAEGAHDGLNSTGECSVDVVVPDGFFAKERPGWLVRWAHLIWTRPYLDDCDFRKHLLFACTIQPLLLPVIFGAMGIFAICSVTVKFVWALIALLLGMRSYPDYGINWFIVFTPFRGSPKDVWDLTFEPERGTNRGGLYTLYSNDGKRRPWYWLVFTPVVWIGFAAVAWLLVSATGLHAFLQASFLALIVVVVMFGLLWALTSFGEKVIDRLPVMTSTSRWKRKRQREIAKRRREDATFEEYLKPLICDPIPMEVSLDALPPKRQTIYLRFKRLKAKVCRPRAA